MNSKPFTRDELVELRRFAEQDAPTRQGARDVLELLRMIEARDRVIENLNATVEALHEVCINWGTDSRELDQMVARVLANRKVPA